MCEVSIPQCVCEVSIPQWPSTQITSFTDALQCCDDTTWCGTSQLICTKTPNFCGGEANKSPKTGIAFSDVLQIFLFQKFAVDATKNPCFARLNLTNRAQTCCDAFFFTVAVFAILQSVDQIVLEGIGQVSKRLYVGISNGAAPRHFYDSFSLSTGPCRNCSKNNYGIRVVNGVFAGSKKGSTSPILLLESKEISFFWQVMLE